MARRALLLTAATAAACLAAAPARATAEPPPLAPLTVAVRVAGAAADRPIRAGERVDYAITVANRGRAAYPAAVVTQLLPDGMHAIGSTPAARPAGGTALGWTVRLAPHGTVRLGVRALAGVPGAPAARAKDGTALSSTVCVRETAAGQPVACGSDFVTLGVPAARVDRGSVNLITALTAAALAAVAAATTLPLLRRHITPT
ncbi:hypothetical protein BIV57_04495 [Mangrovactinospora gilvigrisea]|uniref:DUF11 domain-containing protein n=1 Tax=Mangrovactinospora gilvigrisea TaxID=1428644 RepID=A0A1J7BJ04_9ACTN|nr:DUF11 domain-containing protein [Mangrovactinospora gilvigrisea]OIV38655.1 hypothetical protein BIV57_04495 [Mangrovactinospora gilvigrisea]